MRSMRPPIRSAERLRPRMTVIARGGFTMLELLIVLAIIAILVSISFVVYGAALENAREEATRATLRQLDSALQERINAFNRVNLKSLARTFEVRYDNAGNTPAAVSDVSPEVAEIIIRKDRYRAAFPQRLEDLFGIDGVAGTADDSPLWGVWRGRVNANGLPATNATPRPTGHRNDLESSELLYLALTEGAVFGGSGFNVDRINDRHLQETALDRDGDGTINIPSGDIPGNGIPELVDDWGKPLRFYNWTTRLIRADGPTDPIQLAMFRTTAPVLMPGVPMPSADPLNANVYSDRLNQDPQDPTGALSVAYAAGFFASSFTLQGVGTCPAFDENTFHAFDTYSLPMIVSAGPDGNFGLNDPTVAGGDRLARPIATSASDTANLDPLFDNLTNRQP